jgi:hypothetical protein
MDSQVPTSATLTDPSTFSLSVSITGAERPCVWCYIRDLHTIADGGGVRGISEAVVLHELMVRLQKKCQLPELPRPCDYFHLIGGTSTGG